MQFGKLCQVFIKGDFFFCSADFSLMWAGVIFIHFFGDFANYAFQLSQSYIHICALSFIDYVCACTHVQQNWVVECSSD